MGFTCAHPLGRVEREVYIRLLDEDPASRDAKHCGLLLCCLYGLRDASRAFENVWSPRLFVHVERDLLVYVHGDNVVTYGSRVQLEWSRFKLGTLPADGLRIEVEPDARHATLVLRHLELEEGKSKAVSTPGTTPSTADPGAPLSESDIAIFRSVCIYAAKETARQMQAPGDQAWQAVKRMGRFLLGVPRIMQELWAQRRPS
eukprot:4970836-Amphidinium_carterae.2